jgi:hypothetical protein
VDIFAPSEKESILMKAVTGQYECVHSSGVGLDYFTSRIDRLILYSNGRFLLTIQPQSRVIHAAQHLLQGQQSQTAAPETRREGSYVQGDAFVELAFDGGGFERASVLPNSENIQVGPNIFAKVSDSTFLPPTQRLQQDMDDITKGLKIASTIGGFALKAAKTIQGATQSAPAQSTQPGPFTQTSQPTQNNPAPTYSSPSVPPSSMPAQNSAPMQTQQPAIFCDQCGARGRPGKHFCSNCGARLR